MKLVVIGAGPIGGIVGGRLARAGSDVTLVDIDEEHVRAIREHGLKVEVPDGPFTVSLPAVLPGELSGKFDIGFIAVRSNYTRDALETVEPFLAPGAILVSLQNGINPPLLEEVVGPDHAIGVCIRMQSRRPAPGYVRTAARGRLFIGHMHGKITPQLTTVHRLLDGVIPTEMMENIRGKLWSKLTYTCLGLFGSLADESVRNICENEVNRRLCVDFFAEIVAVGRALGVRFEPLAEYDPNDFHPSRPLDARLAAFDKSARQWPREDRKGPVAQLKRGSKTEIDQVVGLVVESGEKAGVLTPISRAVVRLVHEIEERKRPLRLENYGDLAALVG
ncbi:MAG TPA: 2-dehydropantoate 2-reductase N-terminal domain-containing protein [Candidatus Acidoferrales bacterium]|nr:2-dehydropantoate 2-reductase N-terminal domain-containing protein [Candidatus Acidoferrales bacterium]